MTAVMLGILAFEGLLIYGAIWRLGELIAAQNRHYGVGASLPEDLQEPPDV